MAIVTEAKYVITKKKQIAEYFRYLPSIAFK